MHSIHPLARKGLASVDLPGPISGYRSGVTERLFTNRFAGELSQYPCPLPIGLQEMYANVINDRNIDAQIDTENILFTSGSYIGIDLVIRAFCFPSQDSICVLTPTFGGYKKYAQINLTAVIEVPLTGENYDEVDINTIPFDDVKIIFLCLPNNPVGTILNYQFVEAILAKSKGLVVIDEAYIELADVTSWVSHIRKYPNLVILRTFSKAWGLAGVRAGAVIASSDVVTTLRIIQDPFSLSTPAQIELRSALLDIKRIEASILKIKEARAYLQYKLQQYDFFKKIYKSQTNFILVQLTEDLHASIDGNKSNLLIDNGPNEIPYSFKLAIGNEGEIAEIIELLSQYGGGVCATKNS